MNISKECYLCIYTQVFKVTEKFNLDDNKASKVLREGALVLSKYDISYKPPEIAADVYGKISEILGIEDLFENEKKQSIKEALRFKKILKKRLNKSKNPLFDAVKIAVAGNVIDFGVNHEFDLEKEIKKIFEMKFFKNDFLEFEKEILNANTICYLADNAGENVFDEILIEEIKKKNNQVKIYYVVRGKPIINDVTIKDLEGLDIWNLAEVIDSGVDSPGFCLEKANEKAKEIFFNSDMVISKGMGNFECLFDEKLREIFYLFKVKCEVVARAAGANVGDYMIFKN
jgi:uncharacterized protein with ATP-grasp and redox domains